MSRNSKQRRDTRKKRQQRRGPTAPREDFGYGGFGSGCGGPGFDGDGFDGDPLGPEPRREPPDHERELYELMRVAAASGFGRDRDGATFAGALGSIVELADLVSWERVESAISGLLASMLVSVLESGWQPVEISHLAARDVGGSETRLLTVLIGAHAVDHGAYHRAPPRWVDQLTDLGVNAHAVTGVAALRHWMRVESVTRASFWGPALKLLSRIATVGPLPALLPPPSRWNSAATHGPERESDSKILNRIRGLLAKAESSEFAEEAEMLSAKAQDLMTRYAIEAAMLDSTADTDLTAEVRTRRLLITNPYPDAKTALLDAVCRSNGGKVLWHKEYGLVSIVGMPVDLDLCELLFTSLLVQSSHALREAGTERFARTPSFRRSFLISYASRVAERLAEARDRAAAAASSEYGTALVPVLTARTEAVDDVFAEHFPETVAVKPSITNRSGWISGRRAAENADLTGGRRKIPD
jgi:hypothetical protein